MPKNNKIIFEENEKDLNEFVDYKDDGIKLSATRKRKLQKKWRGRAKKKSNKLSEKQIKLILSQKGKMSTRECAEWFTEKMHGIYRISHQTVWKYWNNKVAKGCFEEQTDIHDILDAMMNGDDINIEETLNKIENKEIKIN